MSDASDDGRAPRGTDDVAPDRPAPGDPSPAPASPAPDGPVDLERRRVAAWLWRLPVLLAAGGGAYGVREAYRIHFAKQAPADPPVFDPVPTEAVAPLARFDADWTGVDFVLGGLPCVAVRVPEAVPGGTRADDGRFLVAYSRVCTHQFCIVDLSTDLELIAFAFNHRTDQPKLTCGCHYSVFDPLGGGRAVGGPAVRPLARVRLAIADRDGEPTVVADGVERTT